MKTEPSDDIERVLMDRNKIDKIFNCLRKVSHVFQEFASDFDKVDLFPASSNFHLHNNNHTLSSKEKEVPSSSESTRPTRDIACQKYDQPRNSVSRAVGDKTPLIRSLNDFESLSLVDQRKYLASQMDSFGKQYLKVIEERDRRRRKLCQLQAEFISLMLPQFSIIHSIMAESLRNEWQNKLNLIDELTRTLSEFDQRVGLSYENIHQEQSSTSSSTASGILLANALMSKRVPSLDPSYVNGIDNKYDVEGTAGFDLVDMQGHYGFPFGNPFARFNDSPADESTDSASECPRMEVDEEQRTSHRSRTTTEDYINFRIESKGNREMDCETPVDLTVSDANNNKASPPQYPSLTFDPVSVKSTVGGKSTKAKKNLLKKPTNKRARPVPSSTPGINKYKICLYSDDNYRCCYIGKDRSCNMRQHWLHRHGVEAPPDNFYLRKDLTDSEVQVYKSNYEAQKAPAKSKEPPLSPPSLSPPASMSALSAVNSQRAPTPNQKKTPPPPSEEEEQPQE